MLPGLEALLFQCCGTGRAALALPLALYLRHMNLESRTILSMMRVDPVSEKNLSGLLPLGLFCIGASAAGTRRVAPLPR